MFDAANLQPFDMHARAQVMCHELQNALNTCFVVARFAGRRIIGPLPVDILG